MLVLLLLLVLDAAVNAFHFNALVSSSTTRQQRRQRLLVLQCEAHDASSSSKKEQGLFGLHLPRVPVAALAVLALNVLGVRRL